MARLNGFGSTSFSVKTQISPEISRLIAEKGPERVFSDWKSAAERARNSGHQDAASIYASEAMAIARTHGVGTG